MLKLIATFNNNLSLRKRLSGLMDPVHPTIQSMPEKSGFAYGDDGVLPFHVAPIGLSDLHKSHQTSIRISEQENKSGINPVIEMLALSSTIDERDRS